MSARWLLLQNVINGHWTYVTLVLEAKCRQDIQQSYIRGLADINTVSIPRKGRIVA